MRTVHGPLPVPALFLVVAALAGCDMIKSKPSESAPGAVPSLGATSAAVPVPAGVANPAIDKLGDVACGLVLALNKNKVLQDTDETTKAVQTVKNRLVEAIKQSPQYADAAKNIDWRVHVLDDEKNLNAYTCPGGNIVVYKGILRPAKDQAGLAAALGHEMTHALARDTYPPLNAATIGSAGAIAAGIAAAKSTKDLSPEATGVLAALGLGAVVGVNQAFSREQELKADRGGLLIMAQAGYDPAEYQGFLSRLMSASCAEQGKLPEFLSSHPEPSTRYQELGKFDDLMKQAKELYSKTKAAPSEPLPVRPCGVA